MLLIAQLPPPLPELRAGDAVRGDRITVEGQRNSAVWLWQGRSTSRPERLWLPLNLLEAQLGFARSDQGRNNRLEWYGRQQAIQSFQTKTLGDEVGLEVGDWLNTLGVSLKRQGNSLSLELPTARLQQLRQGKGATANRLVLDIDKPVFVQRRGNDLRMDLRSDSQQQRSLQRLGLNPQQAGSVLTLKGQASQLQVLTLANPWRVVLDGIKQPAATASRPGPSRGLPLSDPAINALIRRGLVLERRTVRVGVKPLEVLRAGGDLSRLGLTLTPLAMAGSQQGLRFLPQLSRPAGALVAINGGFFNRIKQLPLGALRRNGTWLSGPILNRGVIAWGPNRPLAFGRLRLDQSLQVANGRSWGLGFLNSGYVQRGLSRYTPGWGPFYRSLSGNERGILIRQGSVTEEYTSAQLARGVSLPRGADLVVARGGAPLPARKGDQAQVQLRSSNALGEQPNVLGGGPLLLQRGKVVLNGRGEGFSPGFVRQTAPRTVIGQGRGGTWMLAIRGGAGSNPTLLETTLAMQQLGLSDALNLDGGSSTTLVAGGRTLINGSGSSPRIHNGLGLVP